MFHRQSTTTADLHRRAAGALSDVVETALAPRDSAPTPGLNGQGDCEAADPADTVTTRLNGLLQSKGAGYVLRLCPSTQYLIQAPVLFQSPQQEISTYGYPSDSTRATLVVNGPVFNGTGHTTAVDGTCNTCSGVILRNIQINGTRLGAPPTGGGANIEFGGGNANQLIEYVHSFDPRSWSCLHLAEGPFTCTNATVQNNDIGPCGTDAFQEWADGISVSCQNSLIQNNMIENPTDGGIVLFGAPGTLVQNNTIWVVNHTLLGGINMVDYLPWKGNYTNTIVRNNTILGGFATDNDSATQKDGASKEDVIVKIGIAVGPRTWFGDQYGSNVSSNGTVLNNFFSGAMGYAMAITSAVNFTIQGNELIGNTTFIGSRGPNCSATDTTPTPEPFVFGANDTTNLNLQSQFVTVPDGDSLTCILPPTDGDFWPYGGNPDSPAPVSAGGSGSSSAAAPGSTGSSGGNSGSSSSSSSGSDGGRTAGIVIGVLAGLALALVATFYIRRSAIRRARHQSLNDHHSLVTGAAKEEM